MTQTEFAARLLAIEAYIKLTRVAVLLNDNKTATTKLLESRKLIADLCCNIVAADESTLYLVTTNE